MPLTLYPAIDLKEGRCVRLRRGEMADSTISAADPAAQARSFAAAGSRWLHVVDLDGAFAGKSVNTAAVRAILEAVAIPVQLGGGIRDLAGIEAWLDAGIARVILGSAAAKNPGLVHEACRTHPGRIAIGIDARDGRVATEGWAETSAMTVHDLARLFFYDWASFVIYTDIARDGMLQGLNIQQTLNLARAIATPVIASGGVAGMADLDALLPHADTLDGVIVGRALYDGRLSLADAIARLDSAQIVPR